MELVSTVSGSSSTTTLIASHGGQWEVEDSIRWGCCDTRGIGVGSRDLFPLAEGYE